MSVVRVFAGPAAPPTPSFMTGALPQTSTSHPRVHVTGGAASQVRVDLLPGDAVFGLGAGDRGTPTRNGQKLRLMNRDTLFYGIAGATYASFPLCWVRSEAGDVFAVLLLTSAALDVEVGKDAIVFAGVNADVVADDVVVFAGGAGAILNDIADLTGHSFVPPAWALGFHQSRWSYRTADEVVRVARRFRSEDLPLDVIHLDIHYMDEYRVFTWHPNRFPDPLAMHQTLARDGVRTMAIVDPGVAVASSVAHNELTRLDGCLQTAAGATYVGKVWPGATVFPDFQKPGVSAAWSRFHEVLIQAGVSGFWNDMNDPVFKVGDVYDPLAEDVVHADGPHVLKRNLYANEMAAATVQGLTDARPAERPFVLSRSGFTGIQRHAALWTGDNFSSWEQMVEGLHMIVHLGLCGVPWVGADVGGFGGRRGKYGIVKTKPPSELFVRWLELGALMPFCRVHSVLFGPRQEPWSYSDDVTRLSRTILRRRQRLLPLLMTLAREAAATGLPLWRPMWLQHHVPQTAAALSSLQFMLGEQLLCAPVLHKGARNRRLWLPAGSWLELRTGRVFHADADGAVVDVDAPLGDTPLFIKAGAAFFAATAGKNAPDTLTRPLTMELLAPLPLPLPAPGVAGWRSTLVLDDGVSPVGTWAFLATCVDDDGTLRIDLDAKAAGFVPPQTHLEVRVPVAFTRAVVDGVAVDVGSKSLADEDRAVSVAAFSVPLSARSVVVT